MPHRSQFDGSYYAETNCGPASLAMVLESYGLAYATDALRGEVNRLQGSNDPNQGTSLYAISSVAQRAGLSPMGLNRRMSITDVRDHLNAGRPIITLTRFADLPGNNRFDPATNHYIVLSGMSGDQFIYNDSAYAQGNGRGLLISPENLERAWANSLVPGQAVAFALAADGAGLLSELALSRAPADATDEETEHETGPTLELAATSTSDVAGPGSAQPRVPVSPASTPGLALAAPARATSPTLDAAPWWRPGLSFGLLFAAAPVWLLAAVPRRTAARRTRVLAQGISSGGIDPGGAAANGDSPHGTRPS
jgi:hypothetical protein